MFNRFNEMQFTEYTKAISFFNINKQYLIDLELFISEQMKNFLLININEIVSDYNEASYLFPFWKNYPPEERGRSPIGDQFPWIEVGEQVLGSKVSRHLVQRFVVRDCGLPSGPDQRYVISSPEIMRLTSYTNSCWIFIDVKSVGPRDDAEHAVMSHNQISGNGNWSRIDSGIENDIITASGRRTSHPFHCAIPPIYVLSDGTVVPVVNIVLKPVYDMLGINNLEPEGGQPLSRIDLAIIPNGILLFGKDGYLKHHPHLFYPGKDDKTKNVRKMRARVDFNTLKEINSWRYWSINIKK